MGSLDILKIWYCEISGILKEIVIVILSVVMFWACGNGKRQAEQVPWGQVNNILKYDGLAD